jgi:NAD(P)-dependent dehydrogenase (short-subunit alcohol dehydrogenase family)
MEPGKRFGGEAILAKKIMDSGFSDWTPDLLPDLNGKTYLITGGNSGIGFEAARMLGKAGGRVLIASRSVQKGNAAVAELNSEIRMDVAEFVQLDLADLSSVRAASDQIKKSQKSLDAIINNAGIMQTPPQKTADGFEMQFGTNHLGHFLLNGLLFDLVEAAKGRFVTLSSIAHKYGTLFLGDVMMSENYTPTQAYGQSKLANLAYALELQRRLEKAGSDVTSYACHPGYSDTSLQSTGPKGLFNHLYKVTNPLFAQPAAKGAIPTVLCAAGKEARPGGYYGPQSMSECRGRVSDAQVSAKATNPHDVADLWRQSEALVGFSWSSVLD